MSGASDKDTQLLNWLDDRLRRGPVLFPCYFSSHKTARQVLEEYMADDPETGPDAARKFIDEFIQWHCAHQSET
jgi:hypothetical protein